ncbi:MAG: Gfo/Idh/MocA family oxidoreductase [Reyranella sp.]|uniref:Gfo/Idh/MocA family oxidoreductase n=1 Tax=Reyranella sp. TaxID=1929291 RepID=UPI003D13CF57
MSTNREAGAGKTWSLAPPFRRAGAMGWIADLPTELHGLTDTNQEPYRSQLRLFENGRPLGPPHCLHETIERLGRGRYSFWQGVVYFSSADNSDPNVNGHAYAVALASARDVERLFEDVSASERAPWRKPERPLRCAVIGLGNRGLALAALAQSFAGVQIAWVVDRSEERIAESVKLFGNHVRGTTDVSEPLADSGIDIVFVTVPDHLHRSIAEPAFRAGKHVFLEKPLATNAADARAILAAWQESGRILQLGYVLRQAPFYEAIRAAVRAGVLGPVRIASLSEQLDVRHGASFMRRWHAQSSQSGGLMVHKASHDLDIICWLLETRPSTVSSFGGLDVFVGPPPAPFCSQCDRRPICPYVDTGLHERRTPAEAADPSAYGLDLCVFRTDKDIVDNQVVSFVLDNGVRGTFYLAMQGPRRGERRIALIGDDARLDGVFEVGRFTIAFTDPEREPLVWAIKGRGRGGHGGGDRITMIEFLNACAGRAPAPVVDAQEAIRGLIFALAAERARREEIVVRLEPGDFAVSG